MKLRLEIKLWIYFRFGKWHRALMTGKLVYGVELMKSNSKQTSTLVFFENVVEFPARGVFLHLVKMRRKIFFSSNHDQSHIENLRCTLEKAWQIDLYDRKAKLYFPPVCHKSVAILTIKRGRNRSVGRWKFSFVQCCKSSLPSTWLPFSCEFFCFSKRKSFSFFCRLHFDQYTF